ncbi:MAG: phosphatidylserine decarboxylase [Phycisphaerales bacterium]|nr:MAG: phosphatidylserine decarboxylase [Phycisphaerales bacterium]
MPIAKEGLREIAIATVLLGGLAAAAWWLFWPAAILFLIVWLGILAFFRNPQRHPTGEVGELCAPADGTITEISKLDHHETIGGPAVRIGIFLSILDVHVNRSPCAGTVRSIDHRKGRFLDARHPESGERNEASTMILDTDDGMPGPIVVRQVAGKVARRIVCHAGVGDRMPMGHRFGMIKFGSRTELIFPLLRETEVPAGVGDKTKAGLTILARQGSALMQRSKCEKAGPDAVEKQEVTM